MEDKGIILNIDTLSKNELLELKDKINFKLGSLDNKNKNLEQLNFVDLFCGAGGLSSGLEMAGLNCVLGVDFFDASIRTFAKNHRNAKTFSGPVSTLTEKRLSKLVDGKKIHLLAGGPPCQGFSTIGEGNPDDEKNSLFLEYCRVLKILKPDYILFENVTGILARKNEKTLNKILQKFKALGYDVDIKILESQHYGVPQRRKRTILFGTNTGKDIIFPTKQFDTEINGKYIPAKNVGDALKNLKTSSGNIYNHDKNVTKFKDEINTERLKCIPEGQGIRYKKDEDKFLPKKLKLDINWETIREGRLRELRYYRLDRKKPSPTINTHCHYYYHPKENRRFTCRELASFQSFPSDFIFEGNNSEQKTQIGNAVPPLMGKALGDAVLEVHDQNNDSGVRTGKLKHTKRIQEIRKKAFVYKS